MTKESSSRQTERTTPVAPSPVSKALNHSARRINLLASRYEAEKYLEIGVRAGETFFAVDMPHKVAVDPNFLFDPQEHEEPGCRFLPLTSDVFFAALSGRMEIAPPLSSSGLDGKPLFDIIFIDGLHTFAQSFRDFESSLSYSHENTLWIIDDTVPCDPYSAIPDQSVSLVRRRQAGLHGGLWHGDVFKTIFAIHDRYPKFSYVTVMDNGNPQTILWRAAHPDRKPLFASLEEIQRLNYFDLLDRAAVLLPIKEHMLLDMIGLALNPVDYDAPDKWKALVYRAIVTAKENRYKKHIQEAQKAKPEIR